MAGNLQVICYGMYSAQGKHLSLVDCVTTLTNIFSSSFVTYVAMMAPSSFFSFLCLLCNAFYVLLDGYSPVDVLGITAYTDSHPLCPVCVPSGTLSTLPSARSPHSHQMLLGVVVGGISCGQVSIIQPHDAVEAKTGSTGGRYIPAGLLPGLCIGWWLFGSVSSSILQHPRCIPSVRSDS